MTRTALAPDPQPLWPGLLLSVVVHGVIAVVYVLGVLVMAYLGPSKPILAEQDTIQVSLLAKSDLPTKAMRKRVKEGVQAPKPTPAPEVPPPPVKSDLVLQKDDAPPKEEGVEVESPEPRIDVNDALKELEMQAALDGLDFGDENVAAASPDGEGTESIGAGGVVGDADFARYIAQLQKLFNDRYNVPAAVKQANAGAVVKVLVTIDPSSGRVTGRQVTKSSGVPVLDTAAKNAVDSVGTIPLPPEKFLDRVAQGYEITFK